MKVSAQPDQVVDTQYKRRDTSIPYPNSYDYVQDPKHIRSNDAAY